MKGHMKTGTWTGTGSAITLELGFIPNALVAANVTDGDEVYVWFNGMTAATNIIITTAAATQGSNGVMVNTGVASTTSAGLTLGTALSENAKVYRYIAFGDL